MNNHKPDQWSLADIILVPKSGHLSNTDNNRGIIFTCAIAKIYNRMVLNRIRTPIECHLRFNQNGFRQGRSTVSHILALRRILEEVRKNNLPAVITFLDFKKGFDSIQQNKMFKILKAYGIPPWLLMAFKSMYTNTRARVVTTDGTSDEFEIAASVLLGDTLAPFLFMWSLTMPSRLPSMGEKESLALR